MIRIALSDTAYDAISSTLPKGSARWPMQRDHGQCFIQVESAIVDRMRAMRHAGESYSSVILRLVELQSREPEWTAPDGLRDCREPGSNQCPKMGDEAAERRPNAVAHPSPEAPLLIR